MTCTPTPAVGRDVLYVSYGTPGGEYPSVDRAAKITEVHEPTPEGKAVVSLVVFSPQGLFFPAEVVEGEPLPAGQGGTWHWPVHV